MDIENLPPPPPKVRGPDPSNPPPPPPPPQGRDHQPRRIRDPRKQHELYRPLPDEKAQLPPAPLPPPIPTPPPPPPGIAAWEAERLRRLVAEKASREIEALRLYEPLPTQARFHMSRSRTRLVRGSNRAGKTLSAAVEVARAVTGQDPYKKFPKTDGRCFCVGKNLDHIGSVMWRKLSRAGAFKIIRDKQTGTWRAFRPWSLEDVQREEEARPAPPLIPPRLIKSIAWENKAKGIPSKVVLANGWELNFYSSESKPPQGSDIDLFWFDEEITDELWYPEMAARILDRRGSGIWSATPQAGTEKLYDLHERAEKEAGTRLPSVAEFVVLLSDNPHISLEEKEEFANALMSDDERRVRIGGEYAVTRYRVFPEFSIITHGVDAFAVPAHWTRYAIVDPGRQVCAVLFAAVPPPDEGDYVYFYDELYILNCDAEQFGTKMAQKTNGQRFESFIIDHHGSRVMDTGSGRNVELQYSDALKRRRVKSRKTGFGFQWGSDDVEGGLLAFRSWLLARDDGTTRLRVMRGKLPNFEWEIQRYRYKKNGDHVTDKPEDRGRVHLMACCRYIALANPKYVKPTGGTASLSGAIKAFREKQARAKRAGRGDGPLINLGPGSGKRK